VNNTRHSAASLATPFGWARPRLTDEAPEAPAPSTRPAGGPPWLEFASLPLLVLIWLVAAWLSQSRFLPGPGSVAMEIWDLAREGPLLNDFGATFLRALIGFAMAMVIGTALGVALGRTAWADRLFSPWIVVGLNIPAIVVGILCYISLGLSDVALILAVVINKVPLVTTIMREGVRALSADYDELATTFRMPWPRYLRLVLVPQLMPHLLAGARAGLSLVWKMVLVFEVLGSDGGVGFRVGLYFQLFDVKGILAYTCCFVAVILALEYLVLRPIEGRVLAWRKDRV
jgi:NitT/TauT family transport system permease protein